MNSRLSILIRENKGKRILSDLLPRLVAILGVTEIERLGLSETDRLLARQSAAYAGSVAAEPATFRRVISENNSGKLGLFLECFLSRVGDQTVYYTLRQSEFCGAFVTQLQAVLRHFKELIDLDGDSLAVVTTDEVQGLFVDWNADDPQEYYDIAVWGKDWGAAAESCSPLSFH